MQLSSVDFWRLTLGQFQALCDRKKINLYQSRFDAAALYTLIYNMFSKDEKLSLDQYLGTPPTKKEARKIDKKQFAEKAMKAFEAIFPSGESGSVPNKPTTTKAQKPIK